MKRKRLLTLISCLCVCSLLSVDLTVLAAGEESNHTAEEAVAEQEIDQKTEAEQEETAEEASEETGSGELEYSMEDEEIYSMDEEGNVFIVEEQTPGVLKEGKASSTTKIVNFRADSSGNAVTSTTEYTEYGTGAIGYTYGGSGADAAYLGTTDDGKVKFMLSGVIGVVDASKVQVADFSSAKSYSCYYADGTNLIHRICMDMTTSGWGGSVNVGPQPSYLTGETTYYSYDGHYFYTSYEKMLTDYQKIL